MGLLWNLKSVQVFVFGLIVPSAGPPACFMTCFWASTLKSWRLSWLRCAILDIIMLHNIYLYFYLHNVYYWSWMILVWSEILAKSAAWRLPMQSFTRSCHSNNWSPLRNARRTADQQSPGRFLPLQNLRRNAYVYTIMVWFIYVLVSFNMAPPPTTLPLVVVGGSCGRLVVITTDSSTYRHYQ